MNFEEQILKMRYFLFVFIEFGLNSIYDNLLRSNKFISPHLRAVIQSKKKN